jgi:urease accessory protein UreH
VHRSRQSLPPARAARPEVVVVVEESEGLVGGDAHAQQLAVGTQAVRLRTRRG